MTIDLSVEWARYRAAKEALAHDDAGEHSKCPATKPERLDLAEKDLDKYLMEGVLLETFVLDNINPLMNVPKMQRGFDGYYTEEYSPIHFVRLRRFHT